MPTRPSIDASFRTDLVKSRSRRVGVATGVRHGGTNATPTSDSGPLHVEARLPGENRLFGSSLVSHLYAGATTASTFVTEMWRRRHG